MHRFARRGSLKDKHARPFGVVGILLDKSGLCQTTDDISGGQPIFGEFVVPMLRDADFLTGSQFLQSVKDVTPIAMLPRASQ